MKRLGAVLFMSAFLSACGGESSSTSNTSPDTGGGKGVPVEEVGETTPMVELIPAVETTPMLELTPAVETTPMLELTPAVETTPMVELTPAVETTPMVELTPAIETTPMVELTPAIETTPMVELTPAIETTPMVDLTPAVNRLRQGRMVHLKLQALLRMPTYRYPHNGANVYIRDSGMTVDILDTNDIPVSEYVIMSTRGRLSDVVSSCKSDLLIPFQDHTFPPTVQQRFSVFHPPYLESGLCLLNVYDSPKRTTLPDSPMYDYTQEFRLRPLGADRLNIGLKVVDGEVTPIAVAEYLAGGGFAPSFLFSNDEELVQAAYADAFEVIREYARDPSKTQTDKELSFLGAVMYEKETRNMTGETYLVDAN